ncbi:hypothetical protein EP331_08320 [bacterium]|nr:MAG: hypothetical protein EP331_08320 [bacterium]
MLINTFTRVAALFALGFFISCSTPKEYQAIADAINAGQLDNAIRLADETIAKQPKKTDTYFYHAFALNEKARKTVNAYDRFPIYQSMMKSLAEAEARWQKEKRSSKIRQLHELQYEAWTREYNEAIRLVAANRNKELDDWLAVYETTENAQLIIKDSLSIIPPQIEALAAMEDWRGLDSVMVIYEPVLGKKDWFEIRNIQKAVRNGNIDKAQALLDKSPNLKTPNDFVAIVLNEQVDLPTLINSLAEFSGKGKPSRGFYLLTAHVLWESIVAQTESDTTVLKKFYTSFSINQDQWEIDSTDVLRKASIIDKSVSSIDASNMDQYLTHTKAILFTNIASKLIEDEKKLGLMDNQVSDDAYYFLKKAAPEWTLLIYQFKVSQVESAYTLIQIYDWMDETYRRDELKKEFNF